MSKYYNESEFLHVDNVYTKDYYRGEEGTVPKEYVGKVVDKNGNRVIFSEVYPFKTTKITTFLYSDKQMKQREENGLPLEYTMAMVYTT
jgi:hypothetical protein